tara:strand:+ start:625 stop:873 length:249 start_codon:yes stop_codon:yes gene_type:complete
MLNFLYSCFPYFDVSNNVNNTIDNIKTITNKHIEYIVKLQDELKNFKEFYEAIIENEAILKRFQEYEDRIKALEIERDNLLN